jgi:S1-C subfamily serine protease
VFPSGNTSVNSALRHPDPRRRLDRRCAASVSDDVHDFPPPCPRVTVPGSELSPHRPGSRDIIGRMSSRAPVATTRRHAEAARTTCASALVRVVVEAPPSPPGDDARAPDGTGTGVVVALGRVLAHAHHVTNPTGSLQVVFVDVDGRESVRPAELLSDDGDLAVLSVDTGGAQPLDLARPAEVQLGDAVAAVANPPGTGTRVTFGTVSALGCSASRPSGARVVGFEHTAPLGRRAWGSPLVCTADGSPAGLNVHRREDGEFNVALPTGPALGARIEALLGSAGSR